VRRLNLTAYVLAGLCVAGPAAAQNDKTDTRQLVLQGAFAETLQSAESASGRVNSAGLFDQGLAAFALKDFERAAGLFAQVAQAPGDRELAIRAAVAASFSLAKMGDQAGACEYTAIVRPLVAKMPLLWRGLVDETRRSNNCT
jgi:hypothetical protein